MKGREGFEKNMRKLNVSDVHMKNSKDVSEKSKNGGPKNRRNTSEGRESED